MGNRDIVSCFGTDDLVNQLNFFAYFSNKFWDMIPTGLVKVRRLSLLVRLQLSDHGLVTTDSSIPGVFS
jgi:hypothetical protein